MRLLFATLRFLIFAVGSSALVSAAGTLPAHSSEHALGIALEGVPYPYPVRFFFTTFRGEPVKMAFMDVAPTGASNGRTALLLHGKNFYGSYWENTIRALSAAGFRVVAPDQIGFGKSSKPTGDYTFDLLAAQNSQLLDFLNFQEVAVVGHSMGGMLAVKFARNYPHRTTHLVLENPIGLEDYQQKIPARSTHQLYEQELSLTAGTFRSYVTAYYAQPRPELIDPFVEVRMRLSRSGEFPRWAMAAALTSQMIYRQPVRHEFSQITCPTLLVIGQTDRTAPGKGVAPPEVQKTLGNYPELGKAAAADLPNGLLLALPNVGHIPHLEVPETFNEALVEFLR